MSSSRPRGARLPAPAALLAWVATALLVSGCGFHLRGDVTYPAAMATTYIDANDRYTRFYRQLRDSLRAGGVKLTSDPNAATAVVRILQDETGERVLSVSARNTPREFEVYYVVRYALDLGGRQALAPQELVLNQDYTYDETLVLGKSAERELIKDALARDLVGVVTRRFSSVR
jgi:LPS-assembly lipoprotein